jgi:nicotinate dehydrogenase subunit A
VLDARPCYHGAAETLDVPANASLLSVLRERLDLTGAKIGCAEGACGACTVLVDDTAVRSCVTPVGSVAGRAVLTIEGLVGARAERPAEDRSVGALHPLQRAFLDTGAFQCGYCTPGMIMAAAALLRRHPNPDHDAIVGAMNGNICRCGMYARIVRAIRLAAERQDDEEGAR